MRARIHGAMMIMVSASPGGAHSVTAGAISGLIMLALAFLSVLIKTLKQARNAYQAGKEEPSGVVCLFTSCVCASYTGVSESDVGGLRGCEILVVVKKCNSEVLSY